MIACGWCGGQEAAVMVGGAAALAFGVNAAGWLWLRICAMMRKVRGR